MTKVLPSQPYDPDAHSEAENEMRVDALLEAYDLYPTSVPRPMYAGSKVATFAPPSAPATLDDSERVAGKTSIMPKETMRKTTRLQSCRHMIVPSVTAHKQNQSQQQHDYDYLEQRVQILEERERALIEAVEDLSSQNEELIKKLKKAMKTELQLEFRYARALVLVFHSINICLATLEMHFFARALSLCATQSNSRLAIPSKRQNDDEEEERSSKGGLAAQQRGGDETEAVPRGSTFRNRLSNALRSHKHATSK